MGGQIINIKQLVLFVLLTWTSFLRLLGNASTPIKVVGIIFLVFHLLTTKVEFNVIWVFCYIVITFALGSAWAVASRCAEKLWQRFKHSKQPNDLSWPRLCHVCSSLTKKPWKIVLLPGEDGFFFLPLLYIGITPLTAAIAAGLFAFVHIVNFDLKKCVGTFIIEFIICLTILQHGILPVVVGHLICDLIALLLFSRIRAEETEKILDEIEADASNPQQN